MVTICHSKVYMPFIIISLSSGHWSRIEAEKSPDEQSISTEGALSATRLQQQQLRHEKPLGREEGRIPAVNSGRSHLSEMISKNTGDAMHFQPSSDLLWYQVTLDAGGPLRSPEDGETLHFGNYKCSDHRSLLNTCSAPKNTHWKKAF